MHLVASIRQWITLTFWAMSAITSPQTLCVCNQWGYLDNLAYMGDQLFMFKCPWSRKLHFLSFKATNACPRSKLAPLRERPHFYNTHRDIQYDMLKLLQRSSCTRAGQAGQWNQHEKWLYKSISFLAIYTFDMLQATSFNLFRET